MCVTLPNKCLIGNVCYELYQNHQAKSAANPVNYQCSGCLGRDYAEAFVGTKCDDGRDDTFFDKCGGGFCKGVEDTCLRLERQNNNNELNCEIPKNDMCNLRDGASNYNVVSYGWTPQCTSVWVLSGPWWSWGWVQQQICWNVWGVTKTERKCGCTIDGRTYQHLQENPENSCAHCDVTLAFTKWSYKSQACNDNNRWTHSDFCHPTGSKTGKPAGGYCEGTKIECPIAASAVCLKSSLGSGQPPPSDCDKTYFGQGWNWATWVFGESKVCDDRTAVDPCANVKLCTGDSPVCPPFTRTTPLITSGLAVVSTARGARRYEALADALPRADGGSPDTASFPVSAPLWSVPCGALKYEATLYVVSADDATCNPPAAAVWVAWDKSTTRHDGAPVMLVTPTSAMLASGALVRGVVRATNFDATSAIACTTGSFSSFRLDGTPAGTTAAQVVNVNPVTGARASAMHPGSSLSVAWSLFLEDDWSQWAGSLKFEVRVTYRSVFAAASAPFATFIVRFVGAVSSLVDLRQDPYQDVPHAHSYVVGVRAYSRNGLASNWVDAPAVIVDRTAPPLTGALPWHDGFVPRRAPLSLHWGGVFSPDPETGIAAFYVAWGTMKRSAAGLVDTSVVNWIKLPASTTDYEYPFAGQWQAGVLYYGTVIAQSGAGLNSTATVDIGQQWDSTPPTSLIAAIVPCADFVKAASLEVSYMYTEPESRLDTVNITVGIELLAVGDYRYIPYRAALATRLYTGGLYASRLPIDLTAHNASTCHGCPIHVCLALTNTAEMQSNSVCVSARVERPPVPILPPVNRIPGQATQPLAPPVAHSDMARLEVAWPACAPLSGVTAYTLRVTTNGALTPGGGPLLAAGPGANEVLATYDVHPSNLQALISLPLAWRVPGWTYWVELGCRTCAGHYDVRLSPPLVLDDTAPFVTGLAVGYSPTSNITWTADPSRLWISWWLVELESQVSSIEVAVSTCDPSLRENVRAFTPVAVSAADFNVTGLQLAMGAVRYCASLRVGNTARLVRVSQSQPIGLDLTPPGVSQDWVVRDGFRAAKYGDVDYSANDTVVSATWSEVFADGESGVSQYAWCAGFTPGACDVVERAVTGMEITASAVVTPQVGPLHGKRVFVTVWAMNRAGLFASASSDGVLYDALPASVGTLELLVGGAQGFFSPVARAADYPFVRPPGWAFATLYLRSLDGLALRVDGWNTSHSPMSTYTVSVGTSRGGSDVLAPVIYAPAGGLVQLRSLPLVGPAPIFLSLTARTVAGRLSSSVLNFTVVRDSSPPLIESAQVLASTNGSLVKLQLRGVLDPESGVAAVYVRMLASPGGPLHPEPILVAGTPVGGVLLGAVVVPRLPLRTAVVAQVTVVNGAGALATITSSAFALGAVAPDLFTFRAPAQPLLIAADGSLTVRVEWRPPAPPSGTTITCCSYTVHASTSPTLSSAVALSVAAGSITSDPAAAVSGLVSYDVRVPAVAPGRLYLWLNASNSARLSTIVAAPAPVLVMYSPARAAVTATVIMRAGDAPSSEFLRGHAVVLTHPSSITVMWSMAFPPAADVDVLSFEAKLTAIDPNTAMPLQLRPWTNVGLNRSAHFAGMDLAHPDFVGAVVTAWLRVTSLSGASSEYSSATSLADASPPVAGTVAILGTDATAAVLRGATFSAPFSAAVTINGVLGVLVVGLSGFGADAVAFSVAVGSREYGTDVLPYTPIPLQSNATLRTPSTGAMVEARVALTALSFPQGVRQAVYATVRYADVAGNVGYSVSASCWLVTAAPGAFSVFTGPGGTLRSAATFVPGNATAGVSGNYTVDAAWSLPGGDDCGDVTAATSVCVPGGLQFYQVAVSNSSAEAGVIASFGWRTVLPGSPRALTVTIPGNSTPDGSSVYILVRAVSNAGLVTTAQSPPLLLDPTRPRALSLVHPRALARTHDFVASWSFASLRSGRDLSYRVALGSDVSLAAALLHMEAANITVMGGFSSWSNDSQVADIAPFTSVGSATSYSWADVSALRNESLSLFVTVEGCNGAGVCARIHSTTGARLSSTAPRSVFAPRLVSGLWPYSAQGDPAAQRASLLAAWQPAAALLRGDTVTIAWEQFAVVPPLEVTGYAVVVGDAPGAATFGACADGSVLLSGSTTQCSLALITDPSHSTPLFATVTAFSSNGLASYAVSSPVVVDRTRPAPFAVAVVDPIVMPPFLAISGVAWTVAEEPESAPVRYEYSLVPWAQRNNASSLVSWTAVEPAATRSLALGDSAVLTATLNVTAVTSPGFLALAMRATNLVNLTQTVWAKDPLVFDGSAPLSLSAVVSDGLDVDSDSEFIAQAAASSSSNATSTQGAAMVDVTISWAGFSEPESWIAFYEVGLGTSRAGTPNVVQFARSPGMVAHTFPGVPVKPGEMLFGFVRAVNAANMTSSSVASNGATVDFEPPAITSWAAAALVAAAGLQELSEARGLGRFAHVLSPESLPPSGQAQLAVLASARPLLTVGAAWNAGVSAASGSTCALSASPGDAVLQLPLAAVNGSRAKAARYTTAIPLANVSLQLACAAGYEPSAMGVCMPCGLGDFKPHSGDAVCSRCPAGTWEADAAARSSSLVVSARQLRRVLGSSAGSTACTCLDATTAFDVESGTCDCAPGHVPNPRAGLDGGQCLLLGGAWYKPAIGGQAPVQLCPPGTGPNADHSGCLCGRADLHFDAATRTCGCAPGTHLAQAANTTFCTYCPAGSFKAVVGNASSLCRICPGGSTNNATSTGCSRYIVPGSVVISSSNQSACPPGTQFVIPAAQQGEPTSARCEPCPAGTFQRDFTPLTSDGSHRCAPCPALVSGSYFASATSDLFLDWTGVFHESAGSGVAHYEVTIGTLPGGSQVLPYTRFAANVTTASFSGLAVPAGSPLFLSVVAWDAAGNGRIYEDLRAVFVDGTAPLPGLVVDGSLVGVAKPVRDAAALATVAADAAASAELSERVASVAGVVEDEVLANSVAERLVMAVDRVTMIVTASLLEGEIAEVKAGGTASSVQALTPGALASVLSAAGAVGSLEERMAETAMTIAVNRLAAPLVQLPLLSGLEDAPGAVAPLSRELRGALADTATLAQRRRLAADVIREAAAPAKRGTPPPQWAPFSELSHSQRRARVLDGEPASRGASGQGSGSFNNSRLSDINVTAVMALLSAMPFDPVTVGITGDSPILRCCPELGFNLSQVLFGDAGVPPLLQLRLDNATSTLILDTMAQLGNVSLNDTAADDLLNVINLASAGGVDAAGASRRLFSRSLQSSSSPQEGYDPSPFSTWPGYASHEQPANGSLTMQLGHGIQPEDLPYLMSNGEVSSHGELLAFIEQQANVTAMRPNATLLAENRRLSDSGHSSVCAEAWEGDTAWLQCPVGGVIASIAFASYGMPDGRCGAYSLSSWCRADSSLGVVQAACLNRNSCGVAAINDVFGDPCAGTVKRLYAQAICTGGGLVGFDPFSWRTNGNAFSSGGRLPLQLTTDSPSQTGSAFQATTVWADAWDVTFRFSVRKSRTTNTPAATRSPAAQDAWINSYMLWCYNAYYRVAPFGTWWAYHVVLSGTSGSYASTGFRHCTTVCSSRNWWGSCTGWTTTYCSWQSWTHDVLIDLGAAVPYGARLVVDTCDTPCQNYWWDWWSYQYYGCFTRVQMWLLGGCLPINDYAVYSYAYSNCGVGALVSTEVRQRYYRVVLYNGMTRDNGYMGGYNLKWRLEWPPSPSSTPSPSPTPAARVGEGLTLTVHRDARGAAALGWGERFLGAGGIAPSFSVQFDNFGVWNGGTAGSSVGFFTNGWAAESNAQFWLPYNMWEFDEMEAALYSYPWWGVTWMCLRPHVAPARAWQCWWVATDIRTAVGCNRDLRGCQATMGFTAATAPYASAAHAVNQVWLYNQVPTPTSSASISLSSSRTASITASQTSTSTGSSSQTASPTSTRSATATKTSTATSSRSSTATASSTRSSTASVSASVGPDTWSLLSTDRVGLSCSTSGGGVTACTSALNFCRVGTVNVKPQYAMTAGSRRHACAIDAAGDARCWGDNSAGQAPRAPLTGPWRHVAVTDNCTCLLSDSGAIACVGDVGKLGCPAPLRPLAPSTAAPTFRHFALEQGAPLCAITAADRRVLCFGASGGVTGAYDSLVADAGAVAIASAGSRTCVLGATGVGGADGSEGGAAFCFTNTPGATQLDLFTRAGPFGALSAAGPLSFCGVHAYMRASAPGGQLECWGPAGESVMAGAPPGAIAAGQANFTHVAGSSTDPLLHAVVAQTGRLSSFDGEYFAGALGCAGGRCACDTAVCDARSAQRNAPLDVAYAQGGFSHGLGGRAQLSCAPTCALSLACFGADLADPLARPPPALLAPCALRVPLDVGAPPTAVPFSCTPLSAPTLPALSAPAALCNLRGLWNDGTLFIDQEGESLRVFPRAPAWGGFSYSRFERGERGRLSVDGALEVRDSDAPNPVLKLTGTVSANCSTVRVSAGGAAVWRAAARCAVRFLRVYRPREPDASAAGGEWLPQAPLELGEVAVTTTDGAAVAAGARLSASSVDLPACGTTGSGASAAAACVRRAADGTTATRFVSATNSTDGATALGEWLQLDLGADTYLRAVTLAGASLAGLTVVGYDERLAPAIAPLVAAGPPAGLMAAQLAAAFTYRVVADARSPATPVTTYTFTGVSDACGFDPRATATPSPTATRSASTTASPSLTASSTQTPSPSQTASVTPSQTGTPSRTPSRTPSSTQTGSATGSATPTPTPTASATASATPLPAVLTSDSVLTPEEAALRAALAADAAFVRAGAAAAYDWRSDASFVSLVGAPDVDFQFDRSALRCAWEPFEDVGSGVASVGYCLGTAPFRCDVAPWALAPSVKSHVDSAALTGLNLTAGTIVFCAVAAVNHVGLVSMASSDGVYVDDRPPLIERVLDTGPYFVHPARRGGAAAELLGDATADTVRRAPVDIACDVEGAGVGAAWHDVNAYVGIRRFEWAVGAAPNGTEFLPWTDVGTSSFAYNASVAVPAGADYVVSVRATGLSGRVALAHSDGVRVLTAAQAANERLLCLRSSAAVSSDTY